MLILSLFIHTNRYHSKGMLWLIDRVHDSEPWGCGFEPQRRYSTADDWPKLLSLRTLLVRSVQHLVTYTKLFVCMSSFRIWLMTSSLISTNRVTALEPYIPFIKYNWNFAYRLQISLHIFLISILN